MDKKVIQINSRRPGLNTLLQLETMLISLRQRERDMQNPLLKDWFAIRNQIRALERKIREMKNGKIN
jgi:hypothetical protein